MIEQPPAGQQANGGYYYQGADDYYGNPFDEYRSRLQDMYEGHHDYNSAAFRDWNKNGWVDDAEEEMDDKENHRIETEKPSKVDDATPPSAVDQGDSDETSKEEQPKSDIGSGSKLFNN